MWIMKVNAVPFTTSRRTRLLFNGPQGAAFFAWGKEEKAGKQTQKTNGAERKEFLWQNSIL